MRRKAKLGFCILMLASVSVLPVRAKVISPGSENVRKSYVNKAAVSPKTGEGMEIPGAAVVAGASALLALVADRKRKEEQT